MGHFYLLSNPLLDERLRQKHIKPRLLAHQGTTPPDLVSRAPRIRQAIRDKHRRAGADVAQYGDDMRNGRAGDGGVDDAGGDATPGTMSRRPRRAGLPKWI